MVQETLSAVAIIITFVAFIPYIRSIKRDETRPHVFSWIIWGTTTFVVFLAQLADGAGVGAWPIGVSGLVTIYIAFLAYRHHSDTSITPVDWGFFVCALSALPLWYVTADPMWAVVILTGVDTLGFGPTFRKAYHRPFEEHLTLYALMTIRNLLVVLAVEHYSLTTVLFPATIAVICVLFIVMVTYRRSVARRML